MCVCLFLSHAVAVGVRNARFGEGEGKIILDDVYCGGFERTLLGCSSRRVGQHNCRHSEDAGVICRTGEHTTTPQFMNQGRNSRRITY